MKEATGSSLSTEDAQMLMALIGFSSGDNAPQSDYENSKESVYEQHKASIEAN